jgi:hypothetical protein
MFFGMGLIQPGFICPVRKLFGYDQNQFVAVGPSVVAGALVSQNESGPCRDRTDGPQIKSSSQ